MTDSHDTPEHQLPQNVRDRLNNAAKAIGQHVNRSKDQWMSDVMAKNIPHDIYALALTGKSGDRFKLSRWLGANKIGLRIFPDREELWYGERKLSTFEWRMKDGKVEIMTKDEPDTPESSLTTTTT